MANVGIDLGKSDFVDIAADAGLALAAGTAYSLQNKSDFRLWLLDYEGAGVPTRDSATTIRRRVFVEPGKDATISFVAGSKFYAWYDEGLSGTLVLIEAG